MSIRSGIRPVITKAWTQSIREDYISQRINSERSLQASFWSNLNQLLPPSRRLFIEPPMAVITNEGRKLVRPDVVICNTKEVISVIELKYLPRALPQYKKDIQALARISGSRKYSKNGIMISYERFRGIEQDPTEYVLSSKILFVWAGIHGKQKPDDSVDFSKGYKSLSDCYLQLNAVTDSSAEPSIYQLFS